MPPDEGFTLALPTSATRRWTLFEERRQRRGDLSSQCESNQPGRGPVIGCSRRLPDGWAAAGRAAGVGA